MGLMNLLGLVPKTAEVFMANRTARAAQEHAEHVASLEQLGAEFSRPHGGWFSQVIDAINRLPRPALALGTIGLFVFAMADPVAFGVRMQGLALVPEPLWWLLGAIVSFYFGARELHHFRGNRVGLAPKAVAEVAKNMAAVRAIGDASPQIANVTTVHPSLNETAGGNAALEDWASQQD